MIIIGCSEKKEQKRSRAKDLYISERFILSRKICDEHTDRWLILSAKHGLLEPDKQVDPYDLAIDDLSNESKTNWIDAVSNKIRERSSPMKPVVFLGDPSYFIDIYHNLFHDEITTCIPFKHLNEFHRVEWLKCNLRNSQRNQDLSRLYEILTQEKFKDKYYNSFANLTGRNSLPKRGIYFFMRKSDVRAFEPQSERIIRVGTHAVSNKSKSTLWQRLKAHKGKKDGSGNHRSSIFRLHIGSAIINKSNLDCPTWGVGQTTAKLKNPMEIELEHLVSEYMSEMSVAYISIDDNPSKFSDRAYLEQNMIALVSGPRVPLDVANEDWLGFHCENRTVRSSSMWNVDYTNKDYDPRFLEVLERYIEFMINDIEPPKKSIAPKNWWHEAKSNYKQMMFPT